ncbi:hypothetical protein BN173_3110013 [Clostridioides difficile T11]|nr:hypothetical protein BN173_3110013 [Clostridioides difficile T11]
MNLLSLKTYNFIVILLTPKHKKAILPKSFFGQNDFLYSKLIY